MSATRSHSVHQARDSAKRWTISKLHTWPRIPSAAIALQRELVERIESRPIPRNTRFLAGADVAFSPNGQQVVAGVVLWDLHQQCIIEQRVARVPCRFPYVPGLLSFRELPGVLKAFRALRRRPDAVLCDAQGIAHPRGIGLASHLGLWLNIPTVGCAKSRLCGQHEDPGPHKGDAAPLTLHGIRVGAVLRTRDRVKPLYVSPGHLCDHESAIRLTLAATTRYRLPEPTRQAHQLVTRERKR